MKNIIKNVTLLLGVMAIPATAATISVVPNTTTATVKLSNGTFATAGDRAVIGFFRNFQDDAATRTALGSANRSVILAYIQANFVPLGAPGGPAGFGGPSTVAVNATPSVGGGVTSATGGTALTFNSGAANADTAGGPNRGTRMFLLVYDDPTVDGAGELGIFSAINWLIPTTTSTIMSMVLADVDTQGGTGGAPIGGAGSQYEIYRGSLGSLVLAPLVTIPEPTSGLLALLATLGMISRRRR